MCAWQNRPAQEEGVDVVEGEGLSFWEIDSLTVGKEQKWLMEKASLFEGEDVYLPLVVQDHQDQAKGKGFEMGMKGKQVVEKASPSLSL